MNTSAAQSLEQKLNSKQAVIGVLGLGYAGLPLVEVFVQAGFRVLGFDVDPARVARLEKGESYIRHIASARVRSWREGNDFRPTTDFARLAEVDAALLCVPTPLTEARDPDLTCVLAAARACAGCLRPGMLVVLQSTTYPGTTREVVLPVLEAGGLKCGSDFFLAFSPEREDPGNPHYSAGNIPRVVGGIDSISGRLAGVLYRVALAQVVEVTSAEVAEACKVLENTYRAVNIALVNELKVLYDRMGIDIWEVIEAARTKPFGYQPFFPGPGWGGHCIPIDPFYLAWVARKQGCPTRFVELAGEVNTAMPAYVVSRLFDALNARGQAIKGSRIGLIGMAYKKDVDDPRNSPGVELLALLTEKGAEVSYHDPYLPRLPASRRVPDELASQPLTAEYLAALDCVVIVTDHSNLDWDCIVHQSKLVVDTRNATRDVHVHRDRIVKA
ncbi:MAG: nucleotide sugar dehydrogenase [Gemmataceae bacterium]